jgi:hypothetical protein
MIDKKVLNNINDIFVELSDDGFIKKTKTLNNKISVFIQKKSIYDYNKHTFKYKFISEYVIMFIDYMNNLWEDTEVVYDFKYFWKKRNKTYILDRNEIEIPNNDTDMISIKIEIKKKERKKEGFFKRFIKKFEEVEHNMKHLKKFNERHRKKSYDDLLSKWGDMK